MAKNDIELKNSNLWLKGRGKDTNGNSVIKLFYPNQRGFSIQTNGSLPATHGIFMWGKRMSELSQDELNLIELEASSYISNFGSKKQKESLRTNDILTEKVGKFIMKKGGSVNQLQDNPIQNELQSLFKEGGKIIADNKFRKVIEKHGHRKSAVSLIDRYLQSKTGLSSSDLGDTPVFADGVDEVEQLMKDGSFKQAQQSAEETADSMIEEEMMFKTGGKTPQWNVMVQKTKDSPWEQVNKEPLTGDQADEMRSDYEKSGIKHYSLETHIDLGFKTGGKVNLKLKDWYMKKYPTDDMGSEINDTNTFEDLWNGIHQHKEAYDIIGAGDSIIRERFFDHLAKIKGVDYNYVYEKWLFSDDFKTGGKVPKHDQSRDMKYLSNEPHEQAYKHKRKRPYETMKTGGELEHRYIGNPAIFTSGKLVSPSSLEVGEIYEWTSGAEQLFVKYKGQKTDNPTLKTGSSLGNSDYIFEWMDRKDRYVGLSASAVRGGSVIKHVNIKSLMKEVALEDLQDFEKVLRRAERKLSKDKENVKSQDRVAFLKKEVAKRKAAYGDVSTFKTGGEIGIGSNVDFRKGDTTLTGEITREVDNDNWEIHSTRPFRMVLVKKSNVEGISTGRKRRKFFAGGGEIEPAIYLADIAAYNEGKLIGEWIKLNDFDDADELMEHIQEIVAKWTKEQGIEREEWAVHDHEYLPSSIAGEYMGHGDFEKYYAIKEASEDSGLPLDVVLEWMNVTGNDSADRIEDAYIGGYDNATEMAEEYVDQGMMKPSSHDIYITDTDRRIIAGEESDHYSSEIREESAERLLEEANMDSDEYDEADEDRQEEMLDEAEETIREEYYDNLYNELEDPYNYFVEEQGMYSDEDFFKQPWVSIDYEKVGQELDWEHTFIDGEDGNHYTFTNNYKTGGKVNCPSCSSKGWVLSNDEAGNDDIQKCDDCDVHENDKEAKEAAALAKKSPKEPKKINIAPSWSSGMSMYIMGIENGNDQGYKMAYDALMELAEALDERNEKLNAGKPKEEEEIVEYEGKKIRTINITPTWKSAMSIYITGLRHGNAEGKQAARAGLMDLAKKLESGDIEFKTGGKVRSKASWNRDRLFTSKQPHEQAYKKKRKSKIKDHKRDAALASGEKHETSYKRKIKAKNRSFMLGGDTKSLGQFHYKTGGEVADEIAMTEIKLYIENDGDLYRQQTSPIQKNLMTKLAQGKYNHELAAKLFVYLVESGDKKYRKEFYSSNDQKGYILNPKERLAVAKEFEKEFYDEAKNGEHDEYIPKKYQGKKIKY